MSAVVADVNHFVPLRPQVPSGSCRAVVCVPETSLPPVCSVIHWPEVHPCSRASSFGT